MTENYISLSWSAPEDDGGCPVTAYTVQQREATKRSWLDAGSSGETQLTVTALTEGQAYAFQVAAQNEVGVGAFTELGKTATPKSKFGE